MTPISKSKQNSAKERYSVLRLGICYAQPLVTIVMLIRYEPMWYLPHQVNRLLAMLFATSILVLFIFHRAQIPEDGSRK